MIQRILILSDGKDSLKIKRLDSSKVNLNDYYLCDCSYIYTKINESNLQLFFLLYKYTIFHIELFGK